MIPFVDAGQTGDTTPVMMVSANGARMGLPDRGALPRGTTLRLRDDLILITGADETACVLHRRSGRWSVIMIAGA